MFGSNVLFQCIEFTMPLTYLFHLQDDFDFVFEDFPFVPVARSTAGSWAAFLQSRLSGARTLGHLMEVIAEHQDEMDPMHVSTALHRLARHISRNKREAAMFARDPLKASLLNKLNGAGAVEQLSAQSSCCALWAVARLQMAPPWLPRLMQVCADAASSFSSHQLATALHALAKFAGQGINQSSMMARIGALVDIHDLRQLGSTQ
jgi:hypothetical protein